MTINLWALILLQLTLPDSTIGLERIRNKCYVLNIQRFSLTIVKDWTVLLEAMQIEVLASPEMTGEWEYKLNQILKGELTREKFMEEIRNLTSSITDKIKNFKTSSVETVWEESPIDGKKIYLTPTAYICKDPEISIRKIRGGRMMSKEEIVRLFKGETLGPYGDFRSKKGKQFTASVRLKSNKIEFLFADSTDDFDIEAIKEGKVLGHSPIDDTPVYETPTGYMSASALDGEDKKALKISKLILEKEITPTHVSQLLNDGKTELIEGFISKKKRPFDAYLLLAKNGKVSFDFPPRKSRKKWWNRVTLRMVVILLGQQP